MEKVKHFPYDIKINKEGIYEIYLKDGGKTIELPKLISVKTEQDVIYGHAGACIVTIEISANMINE